LQGATLRQDVHDNEAMYRKRFESRDIVKSKLAPTAAGRKLIAALAKCSPREKS
jgi:hypothetical protein